MSRAAITILTKLVESAEGGGYTLPDALTAAYATYLKVQALKAPEPSPPDARDAAAQIVATVAAGEVADLVALGDELEQAALRAQGHERVLTALSLAVEQAAGAAVAPARPEVVIAEHLRPALERVHAEAREVAAALAGYGLDPHKLISAPAKVRNAYAKVPELVARSEAIYTARRWVNTLGNRIPEHDAQGLFALFADPLSLFPGRYQQSRLPLPEDPAERLLWMVSPKATAARPWLPTVAEQDAAWLKEFGEEARARAGRNVAARAALGQAV
jgi:hypothetical protein